MDFFEKIRALAVQDYQQALILSGMLFTLVIWVFSFLFLLAAVLFFVFFLWGYIPRSDGGLSGFCSRKINKRLMKIVTTKVNKAIYQEEQKRKKAELKAAKKAGTLPPEELKATIPDLGGDKLPEMPMLYRNDTMTTLPPYSSRPGTPGDFELGNLDQKRPMPSRTGTMASTSSNFSSRAPLLGQAADFGRSGSPAPSIPTLPDLSNFPQRTGTAASNRSLGGPSPLTRTNTGGSNFGNGYTASPSTYSGDTMPTMPQPIRSPTASSVGGYRPPPMGRPPQSSRPTVDDYSSTGRASPAPSMTSFRGGGGGAANGPGYPMRSATGPVGPLAPRGPGLQHYPQRNMTAPAHQQMPSNGSYEYFDRPSTANSQRSRPGLGNGWTQDLEGQRGPRY